MRDPFYVGKAGSSAAWETLPYDQVGYHRRTTASSGVSTTETGYVRIDNIPCRNGYSYLVICPNVNVNCTTASAGTPTAVVVNLRGSTSGTATTASTLMGYQRQNQVKTNFTDVTPLIGNFQSTTDGSLSVLVSLARQDNAGTCGIFGSAANPFDMYVWEMGSSVADGGTDL